MTAAFTLYALRGPERRARLLGTEDSAESARTRADGHAKAYGVRVVVNDARERQVHEALPPAPLPAEQDEIVHRILGQLAHHAIRLRKSRRPRDARRLRADAAAIEEIARALRESMDGVVAAAEEGS